MRKFVLAFVIGVVAFGSLVGSALADASVYISPASGLQDDVFTITGSGFVPGQGLAELYVSPAGETFTRYIDGNRAVVVVDDDGTFRVTLIPSIDFSGASAGDWIVRLCTEDTAECYQTTITISV